MLKTWTELDIQGFWDRVSGWQTLRKDCWRWLGHTDKHGRGQYRIGGKRLYAHQIVWQIYHGIIPEGQLICHKCDNGGCLNPIHMFLGTPLDNMRDMISKGRAAWQRPK